MLGLTPVWQFCARCGEWLRAARRTQDSLTYAAVQQARAEQKSLSLLLTLLNQQQLRDFNAYGYFHVIGGSTGSTYRIRADPAVNIDVLGENGAVRYHLCARPVGNIPIYDAMAGQMLFLQDSEVETRFLRHATRHSRLPFAAMEH